MKYNRDKVHSSVDGQECAESVIAACIQRFRYQAPSPSEGRLQIPSDKFWWLNSSTKDDIKSGPQDMVDHVAGDPAENSSSSDFDGHNPAGNMSRALLDNNSYEFEIDAPIRREVSTNNEIFNQGSNVIPNSRAPPMPLSDTVSDDTDLDIVINLDNYAERLLMKCDLLLKGYNTSSSDKNRTVGTGAKSVGRVKTIRDGDSEKSLRKESQGALPANTRSRRDPMKRTVPSILFQDNNYDSDRDSDCSSDSAATSADSDPSLLSSSQTKHHSISQENKLDVSPVGTSLALSADSWGDLLSTHTQQASIPEGGNDLSDSKIEGRRDLGIPYTRGSIESDGSLQSGDSLFRHAIITALEERTDNVSHEEKNVADLLIPMVVPSPPLSPRSERAVLPRGGELFLYVSSSSEIDLTVNEVRKANKKGGTLPSDEEASDECHVTDCQTLKSTDLRSTAISLLSQDQDHNNSIEIEIKGPDERLGILRIDDREIERLVKDGISVLIPVSSDDSTPQRETVADIHRTVQLSESDISSHDIVTHITTTEPATATLTDSDVLPYLEDEITQMLWTRLLCVREQIGQRTHAHSTIDT